MEDQTANIKHINALLEYATASLNSSDAMRFTQAALNAAHVVSVLENAQQLK